jgi:NitT/TauT family transport system substrate-binding protein
MIGPKICAMAAAIIIASVAHALAADPLNLRIQWPSFPGHITPMIPEAPPDLYRHYGTSYTVTPVFMPGSTQSLTALAAGELELAAFTPQSLALAVAEAKLDVRVIAQVLSTDVPGYASPSFWVRKDEVARVEDLKGKVIAVNGRGTAVGAAAVLMMRRKGFKDSDYQIVEVAFQNMLASLESKRVDAAFLLRPWDQRAEQNPALKPLFGMGAVYGRNETGMWVGKTDFIAQHRAALVDFLEDNVRLRRWTDDPKTRAEAVALAAKIGKQPQAAYADWLYTRKDTSFRAADLEVDMKALQSNTNDMKEGGLVPTTIDAKAYVDMSLAKEAVGRAGATN